MSKKIAVLLAKDFEDSEFSDPVQALKDAGHEVIVIGAEKGQTLAGKNGDVKAETDAAIEGTDPSGFDALLIPGGWSPDHLRTDSSSHLLHPNNNPISIAIQNSL